MYYVLSEFFPHIILDQLLKDIYILNKEIHFFYNTQIDLKLRFNKWRVKVLVSWTVERWEFTWCNINLKLRFHISLKLLYLILC